MLITCKIEKGPSQCKRLYYFKSYLNILCDFKVALQILGNASVDVYSNLECDLQKG